jgi:chaperonin GroEL
MKYLAAGIDPYEIKKNIDNDVKKVIEYINSIKQDVDLNKIKEIATISANNDSEIGDLLASAYEKIGKDGVITMEENKGSDTYIRVVEGTQIERGFASPYFINNSDSQTCELINPIIYSHKGNLENLRDILPTLEKVSTNRGSILILTESIEPEVLDTLVINKIQNHLKVCVVKVPFEQLFTETFKQAEKVVVTTTNTTIIAPDTTAKVAVIYVGANTEIELLEKKDRVEDAILAVRSAVEEGIVPGGGFTYLMASKRLEKGIIKNVLKVPAEQIANNAGKCGTLIVAESLTGEIGYNAKSDTYTDLLSEGIIDPAKVTRVALENAASIATMFLLTECVIK